MEEDTNKIIKTALNRGFLKMEIQKKNDSNDYNNLEENSIFKKNNLILMLKKN